MTQSLFGILIALVCVFVFARDGGGVGFFEKAALLRWGKFLGITKKRGNVSLETRSTSSTGGQKGVKLERFDLIPAGPLRELAIHYGRGALKYDVHQWRAGYEWEKSGAAMDRHINAWRRGYDYDVCSNEPEGCLHVKDGVPWSEKSDEPDTCYNHTGSHHMAAVAWHAFLLLEFKDTHPDHDDRYIPGQDAFEGFDLDRIVQSFIYSTRRVKSNFRRHRARDL